MSESDLWVLGKPAKDCPKDWLVVPVKDAVKHETEAVAKARKEEQHFIACAKSDAKYWKEKHAEDVKHYNNLLDKAENMLVNDLYSAIRKQGVELQKIVSKFLHGRTDNEMKALMFFEMSYKAELWDDLLKKARELKK